MEGLIFWVNELVILGLVKPNDEDPVGKASANSNLGSGAVIVSVFKRPRRSSSQTSASLILPSGLVTKEFFILHDCSAARAHLENFFPLEGKERPVEQPVLGGQNREIVEVLRIFWVVQAHTFQCPSDESGKVAC